MFRKLGFLIVVVMATSAAVPAWSGTTSGAISGVIAGYVRDGSGTPQMGAVVEILDSAAQALKVFTDDRGFYSAASLLPGTYSIKVSAPSFLPTLREKIGVRAGAKLMVNVTLTTLFEAIQLVPLRSPVDDDDWKWTLRSVANRPILRVLEDGTTVVAQSGESAADRDLKGSLTFMAGSPGQGFGSPDMSAGFAVERSLLSSGTLRLNGNLGYGADGHRLPAAVLRTTYTNRFNGVFEPSVAITALRLNSPDLNTMPSATLQALSVSSSDRIVLGNKLEMKLGSELQTIQFMGRVHAFKPFGSADLHITPNTVLEYQYASSIPNTRLENRLGEDGSGDDRFEPAAADLSEIAPRMSIAKFSPAVERAYHQEVSISQRVGKNSLQVAFYSDRILDPALSGIGEMSSESGDVLPDVYSGTFSYQGNDYATRGMRVVLQRKLLSDLTATLDYAYGGVLDLSRPDVQLQDAREWIRTEKRQAVAAKFSGTLPKAKTRWIASYRYTGGHALTPVDLFNVSAGQSDPYLNLFIRQPIPASFLAGHMEILMDLRNLLAQGYVPVMGRDGRTLYLVQSARSVRGGVAFSF
ncbi:MAG TPA: carboxypeptidase-like regulatory domain-containing protein [Terriglobales bacterium]|nr:carboxypeptidase-like regulatory domain-containing protein [Terriglobales bacterium]